MNDAGSTLDVDIRALWAMGGMVFRYWYWGFGLLIKPLLIRFLTQRTWAQCALLGTAMHLGGSLLVAVFRLPIALLVSLLVTESLLKQILGASHLGVIGWICPALVLTLFASAADAMVLSKVLKLPIHRRSLGAILLANAICVLAAGFLLVTWAVAHPPEA
ncbi:MAG: hypothetical protein IPP47_08200 [Bryobacterales bacterium]|nr:hypothetical protein [Bryobacterales bacterium]